MCQPDFSAAGGHFNPGGHQHGFANAKGYHAGDMPNVTISRSDQAVEVEFFNTQISLTKGPNAILDNDGAAFILHADKDTYQSAAKAGDRIACGVIKAE